MSDSTAPNLTFLFTDIEGSTRLWEDWPDTMGACLAAHDRLLRETVGKHGGHIMKTTGDGVTAAFPDPTEAVRAAVEMQRALLTGAVPLPYPQVEGPAVFPVRISLHHGPAEWREGDYYGTTMNRTARFRDAAHGGQILASEELIGAVGPALPPGVSMRDWGAHRLRDLSRPVRLFELALDGLSVPDRPPRSLGRYAHNLPVQTTSFIGREREMAEVRRLLKETRLLTLTGIGGCGKTRLALQAAADLVDEYPGGVWLAELAPLTDARLVPEAVAAAMRIRVEPGRETIERLVEAIGVRPTLLLLDNCEHLVQASAETADALLRSCPALRILATSRESLRVPGETTWRVPSLGLPDQPSSEEGDGEGIVQSPAVRLFVERAGAIQTGFALSDRNRRPIAEICRTLDGLPLAIELAAAKVQVLAPEQIARRLDDRFRLLSSGSRTLLPRQQTLRALIDWSYDLLEPTIQTLFRRLSVFAGGWSLEGAEAICSDTVVPMDAVLDLLSALTDRSLVSADLQGEEPRYRFLETVRQYAAGRLAEAGEAEEISRRHRSYFLQLAEAVEPRLLGAEQAEELDRLEREHDNLRAALTSVAAGPGGAQERLRFVAALWRFWYVRGHLTEGRSHSASVTADTPSGDDTLDARAFNAAGNLAWGAGDYGAARRCHELALALRRRLEQSAGIATSLNNLGLVARGQGDHQAAQQYFEESVQLYRQLGDEPRLGMALTNLGALALERDEYGIARESLQESLSIHRARGDQANAVMALHNLGDLALREGDLPAAEALLKQALRERQDIHDRIGQLLSLHALAVVAIQQQNHTRAARLLGALETRRNELGITLQGSRTAGFEADVRRIREGMEPLTFQCCWEEGAQLTAEQAIDLALSSSE